MFKKKEERSEEFTTRLLYLAIDASAAIGQRTGKTEDLGGFFVQLSARFPLPWGCRGRADCTR